jgi:hypothetical protein
MAKNEKTSRSVASKASSLLRNRRTSATTKSVAASALTQTRSEPGESPDDERKDIESCRVQCEQTSAKSAGDREGQEASQAPRSPSGLIIPRLGASGNRPCPHWADRLVRRLCGIATPGGPARHRLCRLIVWMTTAATALLLGDVFETPPLQARSFRGPHVVNYIELKGRWTVCPMAAEGAAVSANRGES